MVYRKQSIPFDKAEKGNQLISPCTPSKAVCVGFNYKDAKVEPNMKWPQEPLLFLKPLSSITDNGSKIFQWPMVKELACEAELAVVIGKRPI